MINCVFIQINEMASRGEEFIRTFEMVFAIGAKFKHLNFNIKEGTTQSIFPLSSIVLLQKIILIFYW